jgi:hypothetical protein
LCLLVSLTLTEGNLLEMIDNIAFRLALVVAQSIEEIKTIISVVSDRSGFDLIKSYE